MGSLGFGSIGSVLSGVDVRTFASLLRTEYRDISSTDDDRHALCLRIRGNDTGRDERITHRSMLSPFTGRAERSDPFMGRFEGGGLEDL